jgi:hypothetical protein
MCIAAQHDNQGQSKREVDRRAVTGIARAKPNTFFEASPGLTPSLAADNALDRTRTCIEPPFRPLFAIFFPCLNHHANSQI